MEDQAEAQLAKLEIGTPPPAHLDLDAPWWCMLLTSDPIFIQNDARADCELLMALAPAGRTIDWAAVSELAPAIYERSALALGSMSTLHLGCAPMGHEEDSCGGRCHGASPAYGMEDFFEEIDEEREFFNRRRKKRRVGSIAPQAWVDVYGPIHARALWLGGFSRPLAPKATFNDWSQSIVAVAQAMLACGAERVERVPRFFAARPGAMEPGAMDLIDAERSDPLRARWAIESATSMARATSSARSL